MDELTNEVPQAPEKRPRKKRSKLQIIKEAYLPFAILALAAVLIITFVIGSISRSVAKRKAEIEASNAAAESLAALQAQQEAEALRLISEAEALAADWDFQAAIDKLDSFSGNMNEHQNLLDKRAEYAQSMSELVVYSDPGEVAQLSFQMLIADPQRAFNDDAYGSAYQENYVTTDEFSAILQQLYDKGYMLVGLHDLVNAEQIIDGTTTYSAAKLRLPVGKKPIVLTQTAANYYTYMTDGDEDGLPDKDGDGFPYCLAVDDAGNFVSKMIDAEGNDVTGNFDFVTILEQFIKDHPDFSYQGARAVLAVTAYDGVFGYRINPETREEQGTDYYAQQVAGATKIVEALKNAGYELACYSYSNVDYGDNDSSVVEGDLLSWIDVAVPVLGDVDIFVYPYGGDLTDDIRDEYEGDRFTAMYNAGFRIFVGLNDTENQANVTDSYFRHTRRWVTGDRLENSTVVFSDFFDTATVVSDQRGSVTSE